MDSDIGKEYMRMWVSSILRNTGFVAVDRLALETLTEMLQSLLTALCQCTQTCCELAGRVNPMIADVILASVSLGLNVTTLPKYLEKYLSDSCKVVLPAPKILPPPKAQSVLQAGTKQPHPQYIPDHLPPFPDSHSYIRTPSQGKPVSEHEELRRKSASRKSDIEWSLHRFIIHCEPTNNLFSNAVDDDNYKLALQIPSPQPWMFLLPTDQVFETDDTADMPLRRRRQRIHKKVNSTDEKEDTEDLDITDEKEEQDVIRQEPTEVIDNPYLRPVR